MENNKYDVIIIGGGPAGLTAAIYTSRAFLKTLVIAGNPPGGQLTETTEVENFPGFVDGIQGPDLISTMRKQAAKFETEFLDENVKSITETTEHDFHVSTETGLSYLSRSIIIATGASAKWLGLESEQRLRGKGVSACATCDGFFFKNKDIAVIGGGDASMEEAEFLTKFASKVYLVTRSSHDNMRASKIMQQRTKDNPKIEFVYDSEVKEVLGTNLVSGLSIINNKTNVESVLNIQGLFVAIGHSPNTAFLNGIVDVDIKGYIKVLENTKSSKEGVFVAGDVADYRYRQAITAAGLGCMAALDVEKYLTGHKE
jgi:thioredoxin reductase (NADPH)